jgi:hypothetical protein
MKLPFAERALIALAGKKGFMTVRELRAVLGLSSGRITRLHKREGCPAFVRDGRA